MLDELRAQSIRSACVGDMLTVQLVLRLGKSLMLLCVRCSVCAVNACCCEAMRVSVRNRWLSISK